MNCNYTFGFFLTRIFNIESISSTVLKDLLPLIQQHNRIFLKLSEAKRACFIASAELALSLDKFLGLIKFLLHTFDIFAISLLSVETI